ncbi:hypothetical protein T484DRAFT_1780247 [Baffinella frigidus]|nr:hypothetical protein T484DRAFT_1780247 [Cryptophyta sp. CCMP2293]
MPTLASMSLSWRRIKTDLTSELTEASIPSAVISIVAGLISAYRSLNSGTTVVSAYRTLNSETTVVLDHFSASSNMGGKSAEENLLQINFNLSFPRLSCEYASVDATNFMGTHEAGLASRVTKIHLDRLGRQLGPHKLGGHKVTNP